MTMATFDGFSALDLLPQHASTAPGLANFGPVDATGEKVAYVGRVWFPARTGTKDIRRICFPFGSVTKAGGSALTISLQDVDASSGNLMPDGTPDQTVAVANADATFATGVWHRSGALSADRTVAPGDLLAVVVEFDGGGRLGADTVSLNAFNGTILNMVGAAAPTHNASAWAGSSNAVPNVIFEMSDGTFGTFMGGQVASAINTHTYQSGTNPNEHALAFTLAQPLQIDGAWLPITIAGTGTYDVILYEGTTVRRSVSMSARSSSTTNARALWVPFEKYDLAASTQYYLAVKATAAANISVYSYDVADANHWTCVRGGPNFNYSTRNGGAWASVTTTRRLAMGMSICGVDDGAGGGSASMMRNPGMTGGLV